MAPTSTPRAAAKPRHDMGRTFTPEEEGRIRAALQDARTRFGSWRLLATAMGVQRDTLARAAMSSKIVSADVAVRLARALGKPLESLYAAAPPPPVVVRPAPDVPLVLGVAGEGDAPSLPAAPPVPRPPPQALPPLPRPAPRVRLQVLPTKPPAVEPRRPSLEPVRTAPPPPQPVSWHLTAKQRKHAAAILPMLPGPGDRRDDCVHYEGRCLKRVALLAIEGHCPAACSDLQVFDRAAYLSHEGARRPGATNGTERRQRSRARQKAA